LLDFNVQPLMFGKAIVDGFGLINDDFDPCPYHTSLLEILSFATNHYATCMQLVVVCNYFGHVYNYKFGIV
jgi:hypothetical protein